ncbi:DUF3574 domain-containing protein [Vibrio palustris]|uniref:DUF3574 domain-containing protein n=1 Tax=Vibrio palustris TaxID=1918946 RepID=A0A1R4B0P9_9VIBR|nr:DUF3574 domain-containing protein [Vibrio palustris]SJL82492.1 hypothetical protein VPAL9027_00421 [Vibrio palustris]
MTLPIFVRSKWMKLGVLTASAVLFGCSNQPAQSAVAAETSTCTVGNQMAETTLYFGMSRPHGPNITEKEWQTFVDKQVTPRFRNGLTVFSGKGQWLGADGSIAKEGSHALMLIHPIQSAESEKNIEALRTLYKTQFKQESVMRVDATKCVSF